MALSFIWAVPAVLAVWGLPSSDLVPHGPSSLPDPAARRCAERLASATDLIGASVVEGPATGEAYEVLGVIQDLVVECASGSVTHFILATGGAGAVGDTLRRLPFSDLSVARSSSGVPQLRLAVSKARLEASLPFTPVMLEAYRSETIIARHPVAREVSWSSAPKEHVPLGGGLFMLMLATELADLAVRSTARPANGVDQARSGETMGQIQELWLDLSTGRVACYSLQNGPRLVVVPMEGCVPRLDVETRTLYLAVPCAALRAAGDRSERNSRVPSRVADVRVPRVWLSRVGSPDLRKTITTTARALERHNAFQAIFCAFQANHCSPRALRSARALVRSGPRGADGAQGPRRPERCTRAEDPALRDREQAHRYGRPRPRDRKR